MEQQPEEVPEDPRKKPRVPSPQPPEENGHALIPVLSNDEAVAIPSTAEMSILLDRVDRIDEMRDLHEAAAAWEATTMRMKKAFEEVAAIAEFRIRLERKIGRYLAQTVRPGRPTKRSARLIISEDDEQDQQLPPGVNGQRAWQYRKLAAVPEDRLDAYLATARKSGRMPSSKGLVRFAGVPATTNKPSKARKAAAERDPESTSGTVGELPAVPEAVVDAVRRLLTVDVLVGGDPKAFPKAQAFKVDSLQGRRLRGDVLVAECLDPATWLPKLAEARQKGELSQVVVVVPAHTGAVWFRQVGEGSWTCCFPTSTNIALLYLGERWHGFWVAFQELGVVFDHGSHG